jgi:hypothetical protein
LTEEDWALLKDYSKILQVISHFMIMNFVNINLLGSSCIPGNFEWWKYTYSVLFYSSIWIIHSSLERAFSWKPRMEQFDWTWSSQAGGVTIFYLIFHLTLHLHSTFSFSDFTYIISLIPGHESPIYDLFRLSLTHVHRFDSLWAIIRYDS